MSYDIVRKIQITDDKVFLTSASSNVSPQEFETWECEYYSKMLKEQGKDAVMQSIAGNVWDGNYHLRHDSKVCQLLDMAFVELRTNENLACFLDTDTAAKYIADLTLYRLGDKDHPKKPQIADLERLRHGKYAVMDICKRNPMAFNYADEKIQSDRKLAREFIFNCAGLIMFQFPEKFKNDKNLAMLALIENGCIYRQLSPELQADKMITRLAFEESLPRRFHEHLPDLVPANLRKDIPFMTSLLKHCPSMHVFRTPELLERRDFALMWVENGKWVLNDLNILPKRFLEDPQFRTILLERYKEDPKALATLQNKYGIIQEDVGKVPLKDLLTAADQKRGAHSSPDRDHGAGERGQL